MIKYKYVLYSISLALLAVVVLLGWGMGTALAAPVTAVNLQTTANSSELLVPTAACEVETTGDNTSDFTSADASAVQAAVDVANPGDLLKVSGTCVGVQQRNGISQTVYVSQSVTIQGGYSTTNWLAAPDPSTYPTILDAGTQGRVVYIPSGLLTVNLDSLTLSHGSSDGGGGIFAGTDVQWSLTNSTVSNSTSSLHGGGVYNAGTLFTATNSVITSNVAISLGGGIYNTGMINTNISGTVVQANTAYNGGGIHLDNGVTFNLNNSSIQHNHATNVGGGLANVTNTGAASVTNSTIFSNTAVDSGAGIFNNGNLTVDNSTIEDNEASNDGGGLLNQAQATIMNNSMIINNRAHTVTVGVTARGAGIYNRATGTVTVMDSTLQYNEALDRGGAIWNGGDFDLVSSTIISNTSGKNGGGIWNSGNLTIAASSILSNTVPGNGAGLLNSNADISITDSTFAFNQANDGGAIYSTGALTPSMSISSSTIRNNLVTGTGTNRGGGIYVNTGHLNLVNSTLSLNTASDNGGALINEGTANLTHVTVANNTASLGPGTGLYSFNASAVMTLTNTAVAYNVGGIDTDCVAALGTIVDNGYNLVQDGSCVTAATSLSGDPLLGPLANNGGNTLTHQPLAFSPVIDHIPALSCGAANDQIGTIRPVDNACDIGAVELALNFPPTAFADAYTTPEDVTLTVLVATGVLTNDTDADFGPLTAVLDTDVATGTLALSSDGSFVYTPTLNFCGTDSFTYHANDGHVDSNVVMVTLNVTCAQDVPVAVVDSYTTDEDTALNVTAPGVLSNDNDPDGDSLTAVLDTNVTTGTLTLNNDGSFSYMPNANFCGTDQFTYHANDGLADSNVVTATLNVTCVNDVPVAVADSYTTDEDTALNIAASGVLSNDSDIEGSPLTAVLDTDVTTGTLILNGDGSFAYTPNADFCGTDSFTYHANDGMDDSNVVTATLNVTCVNDAPVALGESYTTLEDTTLNVAATGVLSNEIDVDGDSLTAVLDTDVTTGTLTLNSDGSFVYIPDTNSCGTDSFTYHANDGQVDSNIVTTTLNVTCIADLPVAADDFYTTPEDTPLIVAAPGILSNDNDGDGDPLTAVLDTTVLTGTLVFTADGSFTYTPVMSWTGFITFTYHVEAGGDNSNIATVTIDIGDVNEAPVAVDDSYVTDENVTLNIAAPGVLDNDTDADGPSLMAVLDSDVTTGTLTLNPDGSFDYTPPLDWFGVTTFTYHATDGFDDSNIAVVTITVNEVNDPPVAVDDSYTVDEDSSDNVLSVLDNDSDPNGDSLSITAVTTAANGTAVISGTTILYTPNPGYSGPDTFTYTISDGDLTDVATVTLTVEPATGFFIYLPFVTKQ